MNNTASPSVGEILRRVRQTYVGEQKKDLLVVRHLYRPLSFPLSVLPLILCLGPNQVTLANFLLVIVSCILFVIGQSVATWIGAALFCAIFVVDCVDGNVARYLNQRRYFGKLIDGLVDVLVYLIYIAIAVGNLRQGRSAFSPLVDLFAGSAIALAMTFTSYFRIRLAQLLGEVRAAAPSVTLHAASQPSATVRLVLGLRAGYENLGPLGPIFLIGALATDAVSEFLSTYAVCYVIFAIAELGYGLFHYRHTLNVTRPSKAT